MIVEDAKGKFAVVPRRDEIKRGTLISIIEQAGLTREEFLKLYLREIYLRRVSMFIRTYEEFLLELAALKKLSENDQSLTVGLLK